LQGKEAYLFSSGNSWANKAIKAVLPEPKGPQNTRPLLFWQNSKNSGVLSKTILPLFLVRA